MNWKQILDLKDGKLIKEKLLQIGKILKEQNNKYKNSQGLMGGKAGIAFFFLYYAKLVNKQEPYDYGLELLSSVFESINSGFNFHTHAGGLAGIGSVMEILSKVDLVEADTNELLSGLDEYLYSLMIQEIKNGNYDFLHGAVGLGFYFLKRQSNENSKNYLNEFVDELDNAATKDEYGVRWLSVLDRVKNTEGFNISLSHGLASIIAFLSKSCLAVHRFTSTFLISPNVDVSGNITTNSSPPKRATVSSFRKTELSRLANIFSSSSPT